MNHLRHEQLPRHWNRGFCAMQVASCDEGSLDVLYVEKRCHFGCHSAWIAWKFLALQWKTLEMAKCI